MVILKIGMLISKLIVRIGPCTKVFPKSGTETLLFL